MVLLPIQARILFEAWQNGGVFVSASVSSGKTLASLLLASVLQAKRAVLLVPAKLMRKPGSRQPGKTERDVETLREHWRLPAVRSFRNNLDPGFEGVTLCSYDVLGPKGGKDLLDKLQPDLLILDEGHKARNQQASRTRKIRHYLQKNPSTRVCVLSGSTIKRMLSDYAHLVLWCLRGSAPVPIRHEILEDWDNCLGEKLALGINRLQPGALAQWCLPGEIEEYGLLNAARRGYYRRFSETPGVVCYHVAAEDIDCEIEVNGLRVDPTPRILGDFEVLRDKWELPDGQELVEGCEVYRHARTMSRGFYLKWKTPAPKDWLEKRKAYRTFTQSKLRTGRFDSPDEVADAYAQDPEVREWRAIRDKFRPETTIVWIDGTYLQTCREWLKHGGIVFTHTIAFGEALAQLAHVPYFGAGGVDSRGNSIDEFRGKACVASFRANFEGRNLQLKDGRGFNRALFAETPESGPDYEQGIGRFHRLGTEADLVTIDVPLACAEDVRVFWQSVRDAELAKHADGGEPKLLLADIDAPGEGDFELSSAMWNVRWDREKFLTGAYG